MEELDVVLRGDCHRDYSGERLMLHFFVFRLSVESYPNHIMKRTYIFLPV